MKAFLASLATSLLWCAALWMPIESTEEIVIKTLAITFVAIGLFATWAEL